MSNTMITIVASVVGVILTLVLVILTIILVRLTSLQRRVANSEFFHSVVKVMEDTRIHRQTIRNYINHKNRHHIVSLEEYNKVLDAADKVSRAYDYLGLLDRNKLIDSNLIDYYYSAPLVDLWDKFLKQYLDGLVNSGKRDKTHLWELRKFYERVQFVRDNHPGLTAKPITEQEWPDNPRENPNDTYWLRNSRKRLRILYMRMRHKPR